MKNKFRFSILSIGILLVSCSAEPTETEVIVTPAPSETTHTVIIEKEEDKKSTSIVLDKNGVKIESKKIDVELNKEE